MKGLLLKDFYTLGRQLKILLLFLVAFAVMPGFSMSAFAIVYAAMLPITAFSYDEHAKWGELAAMMPYSARDIVLGKYLLGYAGIASAALLALAAQLLTAAFGGERLAGEDILSIAPMACVALLLQAVNLPFMIRLGVEKGRMAFLLLTALIVVAGTVLGDSLPALLQGAPSLPVLLGIVAALSILLNFLSVGLSIRFYTHKRA